MALILILAIQRISCYTSYDDFCSFIIIIIIIFLLLLLQYLTLHYIQKLPTTYNINVTYNLSMLTKLTILTLFTIFNILHYNLLISFMLATIGGFLTY